MPVVDSPKLSFSIELWIATALLGEQSAAGELSAADYEQIVESAGHHGVAPLLHHALSRDGTWESYPSKFREQLSYLVRQKVAGDLLRQSDLGPLLDQLDEASIRYVLIKGGGLAYTHYEQSCLRDRSDTDILFPDKAAFEQAWEFLKNIGYSRRNTLSGEFVGYQHCCSRPLTAEVYQVLDCHIKINDYVFYADAFGFEELWDHSVPISNLADSGLTLGPIHALLMACMHRVANIPFGISDRLIWLFDMYLLGKSFEFGDWAEFLNLATERSLCGTCVHSLHAAQDYFPVPVPAEVMTELELAAEKEPFKPGQEMKRWQYYYQVLKSVPGARKKARLLREHFLPSPEYLMEKYQTSNRFALPFLYVHRVFSGLKRYY